MRTSSRSGHSLNVRPRLISLVPLAVRFSTGFVADVGNAQIQVSDEEVIDAALRILAQRLSQSSPLDDPRATRRYLAVRFAGLEHEVFTCLYLDNHRRVIECEDMFRGTIDGAIVHPREVVKRALAHNAAAIILAHNHPSGVAEPSQADELITRRLKEALALIDVRVQDHLVVGAWVASRSFRAPIHLYHAKGLTDGSGCVDDQARYLWIAANVLPCEGEVRAWLRRKVHSLRPADIDDLIQEGYARLWAADFARITNARAYFHATVRNVLFEDARRARIVPMERLGEIDALRITSEDPGPERHAAARQEFERLWRAVSALPQQCRRAFQLQNFEDRSRREIAIELGISERTVEKHLAKALLRVALAMAEDPAMPEGRAQDTPGAIEHDRQ